jgi:hypothetical protein
VVVVEYRDLGDEDCDEGEEGSEEVVESDYQFRSSISGLEVK